MTRKLVASSAGSICAHVGFDDDLGQGGLNTEDWANPMTAIRP
jgi:hypothetical protein